ncbi:hypothetical protein FDECE_10524 [Fusarium decemcellulare]|nr:hypothetical protein FDECE_10524 [Fusarium decemcellulare]
MDDSSEGVILVMGVTGAGKSYFMNQLKSQCVKEGHSLSSETRGCQAVQIFLEDDKRSITVVDTPGFNDTQRSEADILAEITDYLTAQHISGLPLRGILYLHKITDNRVTGASKTSLQVLEDLVGDDALKNVILVSTMWNMLRPQDRKRAAAREQELLDEFWGPMIEKGSYITQFDGTPDSAYALVFQLAGRESVVLDVQKQLVDQDQSILETAAGSTLLHKLEKDYEDYQLKLIDLDGRLDQALQAQPRDKEKIRRLKGDKQEVERILRLIGQSVDRMRIHPGSPMRDRINQAMKESGRKAVLVLGMVLNLTYFAVQLGLDQAAPKAVRGADSLTRRLRTIETRQKDWKIPVGRIRQHRNPWSMDYHETYRGYSIDQRHPPRSQKGRPPYTTERPRSAHSERDYRSTLTSPRPGSRSRSHQGRSSDAASMTPKIEERKSSKSRGIFSRTFGRSSPRAASKQQFSTNNGMKPLGGPNNHTHSTMTALVGYTGSRGRKAAGGQGSFSPSVVQQNSVIVSQTTASRNEIVSHGHLHITQNVVNSPVQKAVMQVHQSPICSPETPQADIAKDQPSDPPPHEDRASKVLDPNSPVEEQNEYKRAMDDQTGIIDELSLERQSLIEALGSERNQHLVQVQELNLEIAKWKARAIDAASKSADVPAQAPLSRPESELLKDWQNLAFDVRNLVANHFSGTREAKLASWAKARGEWICEVTPSHVEVASGRKSGPALVEAVIWNVLMEFVLGSTKLQEDLAQIDTGQHSTLYHQWKSLTTSIVSTVQLQRDRDDEVDRVVEELEDILPPSKTCHRELQAVINKAIEMDLKFRGQQASYLVGWPGQARYNISLDPNSMKLAAGSPKGTRNVRFIIQPCLFRTGGRGESYESPVIIDQCSVWMS